MTCQCAVLGDPIPCLNKKGQCLIISIAPAFFRIWKPAKLYGLNFVSWIYPLAYKRSILS